MSRKIVFIYGRGGGGHKAAARAVQAALLGSGDAVDIELIDAGYTIEAIMNGSPSPRTSGFDVDELYNVLMRVGFHSAASWLGLVGGAFAAGVIPPIATERIIDL